MSVLGWHPSEVTALLAATALGARGLCEVRDAGLSVPLTGEGPTVHQVDLGAAFSANRLAQDVADTTTLDNAEERCRTNCGTSEIDYERTEAQRLSRQQTGHVVPRDLLARIRDFEQAALTRGVTHTTVRRLTEGLGLTGAALQHLTRLNAARADRLPVPVWKLQAGSRRGCLTPVQAMSDCVSSERKSM